MMARKIFQLAPLKLDKYELVLPGYPSIGSFSPFLGWDSTRPTQSLPWYSAYNATKHDRESNFADASLGNVIQAVSGAIVMFWAQFGRSRSGNIETFFSAIKKPAFSTAEEYYFGISEKNAKWVPINCPM